MKTFTSEKFKACSAGIQTNVQGAVPLAQCEHYEKDSIKSEGKKLTLMCRKHANTERSHAGTETL